MSKLKKGLNIAALLFIVAAVVIVVVMRFSGAETVAPSGEELLTPDDSQGSPPVGDDAPDNMSDDPPVGDGVPDVPSDDPPAGDDVVAVPSDSPSEPVYTPAENELGITITYNEQPSWLSTLTLMDGRFYVDPLEVEWATGRDAMQTELFNPEAGGLISLLDAAQRYGLSFEIDTVAKTIGMYDARLLQPPSSGNEGDAYIRLEDIMADSPDGREGSFTDEKLEKLRGLADFMYENGQKYYIAWIPLYVSPPEDIVNDITTDHTLYNANFIYTLDYMIIRGGKIGIHGYSHQENDDESSVGNEFGGTTPYTVAQMRERMEKAQAAADWLGYDVAFFEFPHYACLESALAIAMEMWDVIYQAKPFTDVKSGQIETTELSDGSVIRFIPTPADYAHSEYDGDGIVDRLKNHGSDIVSLFFHPRLDYRAISYRVEDGERTYYYDDSGILPRILAAIQEMGYEFRYF